MNRLTGKQLFMINQKLTEDNTDASETFMKKLEAISELPYEQDETLFYIYKDTIAKASKLGCSLARIKPFAKKNNQTAVLALLTLLVLNRIELQNYDKDIPKLVSILESGDVEQGINWIKVHETEEKS